MRNHMPRKVFIRTDGNETVASGHVMRCLSLADALRENGMDVLFVVSDDCFKTVIEKRGFPLIDLESDWRNIMEGADILVGKCLLCAERPIVVIDTYAVTKQYVGELAAVAEVCYMGIITRDLGDLSMLVNYATNYDVELYLSLYKPRGSRLLLGERYAPLAPGFSGQPKSSDDKVSNVLVATGGTDPFGFALGFLRRALTTRELDGVTFEVVVGGMSADAGRIRKLAYAEDRVNIHSGVSDMAALMRSCDAAVSANGTTVYELAAVGIAAVVFAMTKEQVESAESLAKLGVVDYAGAVPLSGTDVVIDKAIFLLAGLVANPMRAKTLAERAHGFIDGKGAQRIAAEIARL